MADNVTANPGSGGATFATDDIGGIQYPRTKLGFGSDGNYQDVSSENPLPISGTVAATTGPLEWLLRQIRDLLMSPRGYDAAQNRMRETAIIESGTITTLSNISAGTLTNFGGISSGLPPEAMVRHQNIAAWQSVVRSRIT